MAPATFSKDLAVDLDYAMLMLLQQVDDFSKCSDLQNTVQFQHLILPEWDHQKHDPEMQQQLWQKLQQQQQHQRHLQELRQRVELMPRLLSQHKQQQPLQHQNHMHQQHLEQQHGLMQQNISLQRELEFAQKLGLLAQHQKESAQLQNRAHLGLQQPQQTQKQQQIQCLQEHNHGQARKTSGLQDLRKVANNHQLEELPTPQVILQCVQELVKRQQQPLPPKDKRERQRQQKEVTFQEESQTFQQQSVQQEVSQQETSQAHRLEQPLTPCEPQERKLPVGTLERDSKRQEVAGPRRTMASQVLFDVLSLESTTMTRRHRRKGSKRLPKADPGIASDVVSGKMKADGLPQESGLRTAAADSARLILSF